MPQPDRHNAGFASPRRRGGQGASVAYAGSGEPPAAAKRDAVSRDTAFSSAAEKRTAKARNETVVTTAPRMSSTCGQLRASVLKRKPAATASALPPAYVQLDQQPIHCRHVHHDLLVARSLVGSCQGQPHPIERTPARPRQAPTPPAPALCSIRSKKTPDSPVIVPPSKRAAASPDFQWKNESLFGYTASWRKIVLSWLQLVDLPKFMPKSTAFGYIPREISGLG